MAQNERAQLPLHCNFTTSGEDGSALRTADNNSSAGSSASDGEIIWTDEPATTAVGENEAIREEDADSTYTGSDVVTMQQFLMSSLDDEDDVEQQVGTGLAIPASHNDAHTGQQLASTTTTFEQPLSSSGESATLNNTVAGHVMCPICQECIQFNNISHAPLAVSMLCGHMYHEKCLTNWVETGKETCPTCRTTCQKRLIQRVYPEWCPSATFPSSAHVATPQPAHISSRAQDEDPVLHADITNQQRATELLTSRMLCALRLTLAERDQLRTLGAALTDIVSNRLGDMEQCLDRLFHDTEEVGGVMRDQHERLCRLFNQMRAERNEYRLQAAQMGDAYIESRQLCRELLSLAKQLKAGQIEPTHALNQRLLTLCQTQSEQLHLMQLDNDHCHSVLKINHDNDIGPAERERSVSPLPTSRENIVSIMQRYGFSTEEDGDDDDIRKLRDVSECDFNDSVKKTRKSPTSVTYIDQLLSDDNDLDTDKFQDAQLETLYANYIHEYNKLALNKKQPPEWLPLTRSTTRSGTTTVASDFTSNKKIERLRHYVTKARLRNLDLGQTLLSTSSSPVLRQSFCTLDAAGNGAALLSCTNSTTSLALTSLDNTGPRKRLAMSPPLSCIDVVDTHENLGHLVAGRRTTASRDLEMDAELETHDFLYERIVARSRRLQAMELAKSITVCSDSDEEEV